MENQEFDEGIEQAVQVLREAGVEILDACEGSPGHPYREPTIVFAGDQGEGHRVLAVAIAAGLDVHELRRVWRVEEDEPHGPYWHLVLWHEDERLRLAEPTSQRTH